MSGDDAETSHAQAVRFLTSLRAENAASTDHIVLTDEQREFLHSKGMSDDAIERARRDAERPASAALVRASADEGAAAHARDADAFDQAKAEFDAPLRSADVAPPPPPPPPPAASYPRSPLALYSEAPQQRDANEILSQLAATINRPRYDTLVTFFRLLHLLLMLGGGASAVLVWLYRRHLLPRLTRTVDARVSLLTLQRELFSKFAAASAAYRDGALAKLLPPGYEREYVVVEPSVAGAEEPKEGTEDISEEPKEGAEEAAPEPVPSEGTAAEPTDAPDVPEAAEAPAEPSRVLAPIDLTQSLRASLDQLTAALRAAKAARMPSTSVAEADDEGLMDLSMPAAPGSPRAASASLERFRTSFDSMRHELEARLFSEAETVKVVEHRFGAVPGSSMRAPSGPAVEMRQIKAEIRSLKGLMLSRRNFPSYQRAVRSTPQIST